MDEKGLGALLQTARRQAGLTQQELCHQANLSYSTLAKIERGAIKAPSIFTIQNIAAALGTNLDSLLGTPNGVNRKTAKTKSGVSFIYFDVNGCLVRFYERAFSRMAEDYGIPADAIETAFWHYNDEACRGTLTLADFDAAMAKRLGIASLDWQKYYVKYSESVPGMAKLLTWVTQTYRIGLFTNIMPGLLTALQQADKVPKLAYDAVIDSSQFGSIKPDQAIYEVAQAQAGVPAEEILLIDDTKANLIQAEKLGWHVLWFDYARPVESTAKIRDALAPAD